jgi:DNA-binding transcriptional ArsR family regulator
MPKIKVTVVLDGMEYTVEGDPESVLRNVLQWVYKIMPEVDLARRLMVDIDYMRLSDVLSKYVMTSEEGDIIFKEDIPQRLSLSNKILIALGLSKLLYQLGKRDEDGIYLHELAKYVVSSTKTVSSRLSELYSTGYVEKNKMEDGVLYRITIKGLLRLLSMG